MEDMPTNACDLIDIGTRSDGFADGRNNRSAFIVSTQTKYEIIGAETNNDALPAVSRIGTKNFKEWIQQDGPQRAWIMDNLRTQVVVFLEAI